MSKMTDHSELAAKIRGKKSVITVMGLGYVGLPIALEFAAKGFPVCGLDNNKKRVEKLKAGRSYINDIPSSKIKKAVRKANFKATTDESVLGESDAVIICVPTPLRKVKDPDVSYVIKAARSMAKYVKRGQLVILESTTYPGTTRDIMMPLLEKKGLKAGKDFFLAFSPERIDPGNKKYSFVNIPKVVGGVDAKSTELGELLYSRVVGRTIGVSTMETAEVTKLLENTFRIVNIALVNEFSMLCNKLGIDVWEVIKAASTKPFGYMPFYPGPGIGGHCIPADPMYLSWKARKVGFKTKMIDLAAVTNRLVPNYVVERIRSILSNQGRKLSLSRVLVVGVTYKKDVNDLRESPALDIINALEKAGTKVSFTDPYIPSLDLPDIRIKGSRLNAELVRRQDLVLIAADHTGLNYRMIAAKAKCIFDTRAIFEALGIKGKNIIKL
ncbi:MAG: nucleotide sugar dehydrogenase [Candidatus Omnitrophica bacterium]|nr:nucleotide sugar dehydrogenase [Candidatus Omnitrophota bacterium]MDD4013301.1 nucleotide sugar dehydrogenase [Candidatus Omnitrophota bacterium]